MATVHLRPIQCLALALPAAMATPNPNWLPLPAKPRARRRRSRLALLVCAASKIPTPAAPSPSSGQDKARDAAASAAARWAAWIPRAAVGGAGPEQVLRLISGAAATPICQFVDSPRTFLHSVDPRVKLVWLLALVVLPARSNIYMRFGLVVYLALLSMWVLPKNIWKDQLGRVALLSGLIFIMLGFGSDGAPSLVQTRTPPPSVVGVPNIPCSSSGYSYTIMKLGPLQFTRKGLSVASTSACLTFAIFQSASLCLTTTTPEQLASALWWFMIPLKYIGVPVPEIILTLLLSLRFINLVFDEVRNSALAIVARRINWKGLATMETIDIFFNYIQRIFKNIFDHAEQISKISRCHACELLFMILLMRAELPFMTKFTHVKVLAYCSRAHSEVKLVRIEIKIISFLIRWIYFLIRYVYYLIDIFYLLEMSFLKDRDYFLEVKSSYPY